jgi:Secretion system C-terminal sorting domain
MIKSLFSTLFIMIILSSFSYGKQKPILLNKTTTDTANIYSTIINTGALTHYVSTNTRGGWDNYAIHIGSKEDSLPSMEWWEGGYADNNYLYEGYIWVSTDRKDVRLYSETCNDFKVQQSDPYSGEPMIISFSMTDALADSIYHIGAKVICKVYAWNQPIVDDFLIYEILVINTSGQSMEDVYVGLHMDCDVSSAGGTYNNYGFNRDDIDGFYMGADTNGNNESISYMFDGDLFVFPGEDTGGRYNPKESLGYLGSRLLHCPPSKNGVPKDRQSGHQADNWGTWAGYGDLGWWNGWSVMHQEEFEASTNYPQDWRYMQTAGPWQLFADDTLTIAFGIGIGVGLDGLRENLQYAYDVYKSMAYRPKILDYFPKSDTVIAYVGESIKFCVRGEDNMIYRWGINDNLLGNYDSTYAFRASKFNIGKNVLIGTVSDNQYSHTKRWVLIVKPAKKYELSQNYPNPFNGITTIPFELQKDGSVNITIYDVLGRKVKTLINKPYTFGKHTISWDGTDAKSNNVSSGIYLYRIKSNNYSKTKRLLLLR